jgi:hypothetical protein
VNPMKGNILWFFTPFSLRFPLSKNPPIDLTHSLLYNRVRIRSSVYIVKKPFVLGILRERASERDRERKGERERERGGGEGGRERDARKRKRVRVKECECV